jgi:hypothetical protein
MKIELTRRTGRRTPWDGRQRERHRDAATRKLSSGDAREAVKNSSPPDFLSRHPGEGRGPIRSTDCVFFLFSFRGRKPGFNSTLEVSRFAQNRVARVGSPKPVMFNIGLNKAMPTTAMERERSSIKKYLTYANQSGARCS